MNSVTRHTDIIKRSVGDRRYGLADIAKLAIAIVAVVFLYIYETKLPILTQAILGFAIIVTFLFWYMKEYALKLEDQISDGRVKIAELRHKGVRLRNEANRNIVDEKSLIDWAKRADEWKDEVIAALEAISKSDAIWFSVLDVVPPPRMEPNIVPNQKGAEETFLHLYRFHDYRLHLLGQLIRDLWGRK